MYPVLLVHGIDDTSARLGKMRTVLQAQGFGLVHAMDITPPDASISFAAMGRQVQDNVIALQQKADVQKVDIVLIAWGHWLCVIFCIGWTGACSCAVLSPWQDHIMAR